MLVFRHQTLICISGFIWLGIGCFLLTIGLRFIFSDVSADAVQQAASHRSQELPLLLGYLARFAGGAEKGAIVLVAMSLMIGFVKGRYVLVKSVDRVVERICRFPNPTHLFNMYSYSYYLLIACMILLGASMKYFHFPTDIRGAVDVAVGAALMNGAMLYFRRLPRLS